MNELTVGHYHYYRKTDASERWFRKHNTLDGVEVVPTGKRISTANNEIVKLRGEVKRLRETLEIAAIVVSDKKGATAEECKCLYDQIDSVLYPPEDSDE